MMSLEGITKKLESLSVKFHDPDEAYLHWYKECSGKSEPKNIEQILRKGIEKFELNGNIKLLLTGFYLTNKDHKNYLTRLKEIVDDFEFANPAVATIIITSLLNKRLPYQDPPRHVFVASEEKELLFELAEKGNEIGQNNLDFIRKYAYIAEIFGEYQKALKAYSDVSAIYVQKIEIIEHHKNAINIARNLIHVGESINALITLKTLNIPKAQSVRESYAYNFVAGLANAQLGFTGTAEAYFKQVAGKKTEDPSSNMYKSNAYAWLSVIAISKGDYKKALTYAEEIKKLSLEMYRKERDLINGLWNKGEFHVPQDFLKRLEKEYWNSLISGKMPWSSVLKEKGWLPAGYVTLRN